MNNGETKGGSTPTLVTFSRTPGLKQLWQLHYSDEGGEAHNVPAAYIANLKGPSGGANDHGYGLKLTVGPDEMPVFNERTGATVNYPLKH